MDMPTYARELDARPGSEWSDQDADRLLGWWMEPERMRLLWYYGARYLGSGASRQDVEDAVMELYMMFDRVRRQYRPGGPSFAGFLIHVCFRNYCLRVGGQVRKRLAEETPLVRTAADSSEYTLDAPDERPSGDPERHAEGVALRDDLSEILRGCALPASQREVFALRYLAGLSYDEIADRVGAPVGSVKGWLSRATTTVRQYLTERGWAS